MASIPTWKEKQSLLFGNKASNEKLSALGQKCEKEGFLHEALEYFAYGQDEDGLKRIKEKAIEHGDGFLLKAVARESPSLVSQSDKSRAKTQAQKQGKSLFAGMLDET